MATNKTKQLNTDLEKMKNLSQKDIFKILKSNLNLHICHIERNLSNLDNLTELIKKLLWTLQEITSIIDNQMKYNLSYSKENYESIKENKDILKNFFESCNNFFNEDLSLSLISLKKQVNKNFLKNERDILKNHGNESKIKGYIDKVQRFRTSCLVVLKLLQELK